MKAMRTSARMNRSTRGLVRGRGCAAAAAALFICTMCPGAPSGAAADALPEDDVITFLRYERLETRAATRDAALGHLMPTIEAGPWWLIGPFDNSDRAHHGTVYPPETHFDPHARYEGKGGRPVQWKVLEGYDEEQPWARIDLVRFGEHALNTDAIAYLLRDIVIREAAEITFDAGSDDGLKLWINGRLEVDADVYRGFDPEQHAIRVTLGPGTHRILAKVTQGAGAWEFQMRPRIDSRVVSMLDYYLDRDFPRSPAAQHYRALSVLEPPDLFLEVGGLAVMPDGRPVVATRRGEVFVVDGAYDDPPFAARFTRFAFGLHEPLGAVWEGDGLVVVQRGELTRLRDTTGDGRADHFEALSEPWGLSGNYHEFAFGPEIDGEGRYWVTLNIAFCGALGKSLVPWRGWAMMVQPDGSLLPVAGGLRSPNGLGVNAQGEMFATDNQGDWVATNKLMHLEPGDWHGHPAGNQWYERAGMTPPRGEESFKAPAVWFPYDRMGRSPSDILLIDQDGRFGPWDGQLLVGDQYAASVMRVDLESVNGVWQGACFPFIDGLDSGVNRLAFGPDGSLFVGMTNRGWWSFGRRQWGLQRVVYTGLPPFDLHSIRARPDGFELTFTAPIDEERGGDPAAYAVESFTHERTERYGAPEIDRRTHPVRHAHLSECRTRVRLEIGGLRRGYVHGIEVSGVRSDAGAALLHGIGFYTLNEVPGS